MMATWRTTTIDDACNVEYGTRVVQNRDGGSIYPVYGGGGATFFMDRSNRANRVVVSRFGMSEECTRLVDGEFFLNDSGLTLSPKDTSSLLQTFLDRLTLALNAEIFALGKGSAQKNLDVPAFRGLRIAYPASLAEQRRIVAILDEAFEGIATAKANAEKNLQNARALYVGHLQVVFGRRGEGYIERRLRDVAREFGRGKSRHRPRNDPALYGGPYPFIQTGDISNADHWLEEFTQSYSEHGLQQSRQWPAGTVCIAIVGATVGESAILRFAACFPDSVIGIVVNSRIADGEYVEYMLQSFKQLLKKLGQGTARDNINLGTFENQLFPFPPLDRQQEIAQVLSRFKAELRRLEEICSLKLAALDELKQSLLHQAFNGLL